MNLIKTGETPTGQPIHLFYEEWGQEPPRSAYTWLAVKP